MELQAVRSQTEADAKRIVGRITGFNPDDVSDKTSLVNHWEAIRDRIQIETGRRIECRDINRVTFGELVRLLTEDSS